MERETLKELGGSAVQLVRKISEGSYGTVNVARMMTPAYGQSEVEIM